MSHAHSTRVSPFGPFSHPSSMSCLEFSGSCSRRVALSRDTMRKVLGEAASGPGCSCPGSRDHLLCRACFRIVSAAKGCRIQFSRDFWRAPTERGPPGPPKPEPAPAARACVFPAAAASRFIAVMCLSVPFVKGNEGG